ncbi:MAG: oligosaccharide flippase family protein, partial [Candidatus Micrarchaeota archaeon]|nr:oligosaccharide flippase family protein [Candidatus Micrarchaeota archaeon]
LIVVARYLGPANYGLYTRALAAVGIFGSIGNLGVSTALNKFIAEYKAKGDSKKLSRLVSNSFLMLFVSGVVLTAVVYLLSGIITPYVLHTQQYTYIIQIASMVILTSVIYSSTNYALIGFRDGRRVAISLTFEALVQAIVSIGFAIYGLGALAPIVGIIIGQAVASSAALAFIFRDSSPGLKFAPSVAEIKRLIRFSMPIWLSNLSNSLVTNLSQIALGIIITGVSGALAANVVLGNFGIATKVGTIIALITTNATTAASVESVLVSMFAGAMSSKEGKKNANRLYSYSMYYAFLLTSPIILFIVALAQPISFLAFSGHYLKAPLYISLMGIGMLISLLTNQTKTIFIGSNNVDTILKYDLLVAVIQAAVALPLLYNLQGSGLIILLFVIAPIISGFLYLRRAISEYKIAFDFGKLCRIILANIVAIALILPLILLLDGQYAVLLVAAAIELVVVYPILIAVLRAVEMRDISILKRLFENVPAFGGIVSALLDYSSRFIR